MTVSVIRRKSDRVITCNKCETILCFDKEKDIKKETYKKISLLSHEEEERAFPYIICPECGNRVYTSIEEQLNKIIQQYYYEEDKCYYFSRLDEWTNQEYKIWDEVGDFFDKNKIMYTDDWQEIKPRFYSYAFINEEGRLDSNIFFIGNRGD